MCDEYTASTLAVEKGRPLRTSFRNTPFGQRVICASDSMPAFLITSFTSGMRSRTRFGDRSTLTQPGTALSPHPRLTLSASMVASLSEARPACGRHTPKRTGIRAVRRQRMQPGLAALAEGNDPTLVSPPRRCDAIGDLRRGMTTVRDVDSNSNQRPPPAQCSVQSICNLSGPTGGRERWRRTLRGQLVGS